MTWENLMTRRHLTGSLAVALGVSLAGCSNGELGQGTFTYVCTGDHDDYCGRPIPVAFTEAVAVGATFDLAYEPVSTSGARFLSAATGVRPASPHVAQEISTATQRGMKFLVPGEGAFLAHGAHGTVLDFIHLVAEEPAAATIDAWEGYWTNAGLWLSRGQTTTLIAAPVGQDGRRLLGTMTCTWFADDGDLVALSDVDVDGACTVSLRALESGTTMVNVTMGGTTTGQVLVNIPEAP